MEGLHSTGGSAFFGIDKSLSIEKKDTAISTANTAFVPAANLSAEDRKELKISPSADPTEFHEIKGEAAKRYKEEGVALLQSPETGEFIAGPKMHPGALDRLKSGTAAIHKLDGTKLEGVKGRIVSQKEYDRYKGIFDQQLKSMQDQQKRLNERQSHLADPNTQVKSELTGRTSVIDGNGSAKQSLELSEKQKGQRSKSSQIKSFSQKITAKLDAFWSKMDQLQKKQEKQAAQATRQEERHDLKTSGEKDRFNKASVGILPSARVNSRSFDLGWVGQLNLEQRSSFTPVDSHSAAEAKLQSNSEHPMLDQKDMEQVVAAGKVRIFNVEDDHNRLASVPQQVATPAQSLHIDAYGKAQLSDNMGLWLKTLAGAFVQRGGPPGSAKGRPG